MAALLLLLLSILTSTHCSCDSSHRHLLSLAFSSVSGFHLPPPSPTGACIRHLHLPSQNLSGTLSWMFLRNITTLQTLDLSSNSLDGSVPGSFWSSPALTAVSLAGNHLGGPLRFENSGLRFLNLSSNRFTAASNLSILRSLKVLDLSHNKLGVTPPGLNSLPNVEYLDLSNNSMTGLFPSDFPAIAGLRFLNLSYNNLTGVIDSAALDKFGSSAFVKGGIFTYAAPPSERHKEKKHGKDRAWRTGLIAAAAAAVGVVIIAVVIAGGFYRRKKRSPEKERREVREEELEWVREARWGAAGGGVGEGDLVAATSGFGRESLMAEGGRSGPIYRALLPGDMHVVVRVMERDRGGDSSAAGAALTERPAGQPSVEDWTGDTWEESLPSDNRPSSSAAAATTISCDRPTRHRIALGVARGIAFLHQGWVGSHSPVVHGHLTPSNILLSDDLEPRISDFAGGGGGATAEDDVYSFGVVVMELVTGKSDWPEVEVERIRGLVREGPAAAVVEVVDRRLQWDAEWEKEAVECLRVGYLCTAKSPEE
ncbi:LOW QUALITY PROTEIN: probable LRR receptor-like serine/threonine-protein kinase At2g24230, partial [Phalaenopsis equestris]|uniref:LOW QUALITY PROTEIN: probable LRR receptor-like serine/threonine-protein kinase At2g24230 n=1 Tax=Phalaenopsis equestris TaxID=78828 RepID=UPI0009E37D47